MHASRLNFRSTRPAHVTKQTSLFSGPSATRIALLAFLSLLFAAQGGLALDHGGAIESNETWFAADNPHVIVESVTVNAGVTLTLEPGVEIFLNASRRLTVQGFLDATGAPGQEILFTRNTASDWSYIYFQTGGGGTLEHCIIEYGTYGIYANSIAGISLANVTVRNSNFGINAIATNAISVSDCQFQDNSYGIKITGGSIDLASTSFTGNTTNGFYGDGVAPGLLDANMVFTNNATAFRVDDVVSLNLTTGMTVTGSTTTGIHLDNCDGATVDNQVLTGNTGVNGAFYVDDCGDFTLGASNTIGGPSLENSWPLTIGSGTYPSASGVIPTSGNTNNDIQVNGGSSTKTGTWRKFTDLDYVITTSTTVQAGGELTIEPAVTVKLDPSRRLTIQGFLDATGTPGQDILFTRNGTSDWSYIYFQTGGNGILEHCIIEYATYAIYGNSTGTISVSNVELRNNNYAINAIATNVFTVSNCQFQDNSYGIKVTGGSIDLASTSFTGNTTYGFYGDGVAPGILDANMVFTDNATAFRVDDVAGFNLATGMTVTSSINTGIHLDDCDGATVDNQVLTGNTGVNGAFYVDDCGDFTLGANNTIGGGGPENSWPLTIGAGTFPSASGVIPTTGNTNNDIQVNAGSSSKTGTWRKFTDLDFIVTTNSTVEVGGGLTIEPAVTVKFDPSRRLTIQGTLTAIGSPGQEILFTRNGVSDWSYLYFQTGGSGTLEHCVIEHATYAIYGNSTGTISVSNVELRNNNYAINAVATNAISVSDCQFQDNSYGIKITGGSIDLASTSFTGNTTYGFYSTGVAPGLLDDNMVFTDNTTGFRVDDVAGLSLTASMTVTGNTTTGIYLEDCDGATVDNQILTGNTGTNGAFYVDDCGNFTLGANNTIGGGGPENSWPLTIGAGTFPSASGVIPTAGNTNNDIQVSGGSSSKTGTWRKFTDLDFIVTTNPTVEVGGELIIEPAVTVKLDPSRRLGIQGTLTAIGSPGQEILFTRNGVSDWSYLYFQTGGGGTLEHCIIEHGTYAIYANSNGAISASNVTIQDSNYGINSISANNIFLTDCLIQNNTSGIRASGGTLTFLRSRIVNNTSYGLYLSGGTPTFGNSLSEWNDIYGNGSGDPGRDLRNGDFDIAARYVYWGTLTQAIIEDRIHHQPDDEDLGLVNFNPWINAAHDTEYTGGPSGVDDGTEAQLPSVFRLGQNAPNPFNPSTVIRFDLTGTSPVKLKIFDVSGALVATLVDQQLPAGYHEVAWRGSDDRGRTVPSGVYFYRIAAGDIIETKRMMLVK